MDVWPSDYNASRSRLMKLRDVSKKIGLPPQALQYRYAIERFLYRLSLSDRRDDLILKGGMAVFHWSGSFARPTKDIDIVSLDERTTVKEIAQFIEHLSNIDVKGADPIHFDTSAMKQTPQREDEKNPGVRIEFVARIGPTAIPVKIDIAWGESVLPAPRLIEFPTLLGEESPKIMAYPLESILAEKLETHTGRGFSKVSRVKDIWDMWFLSTLHEMEISPLAEAIRGTFAKRGTEIPPVDEAPLWLPEYVDRALPYWNSFLAKDGALIKPDLPLQDLLGHIKLFLGPALEMARDPAAHNVGVWTPDQGWSEPRPELVMALS